MSDDLSSVKRRLSARLLAIDGIAGVGVREGKLVIYLERPDDDARRKVSALVAVEAPGTVVEYVESGEFRVK
jgi:hypothetical protein